MAPSVPAAVRRRVLMMDGPPSETIQTNVAFPLASTPTPTSLVDLMGSDASWIAPNTPVAARVRVCLWETG